MENENNLPFKVGELAEAKSFEEGFRGAWFRCKITDITKVEGKLVHVLEYYDFPDENLERLKAYQVPPYIVGDAKGEHEEPMLRPQYPPIHDKMKMPHVSEISEVTVVLHNSWKVGDLVDWWSNDCYWSGRIKKFLGDDRVQIELKQPPFGEGSEYDGFLKDLRPSLDWSPENGWTVPSQERLRPCARLMKPVNQVISVQKGGVTEEEEKCKPSREIVGSEELGEKWDSNSMDAAVMKLEEYVKQVKLLKILLLGISSDEQWEFNPK